MANRFLLSLLVLVSCMLIASGSFADADAEKAVIYFYGFEIQRITGIHEEEIERLGCIFSADSDAISSTLTNVEVGNGNYDRRDVRAKIEMRGKHYFVDRAGIVRQGDNYFLLDKARFAASIVSAGTCK